MLIAFYLLGQLEQLIEDDGKFSLPQMISTERPDKASNFLLEGRVVILVNGSPYSLIAPGTFIDFITSPEDTNLKYQFANLLLIYCIQVLYFLGCGIKSGGLFLKTWGMGYMAQVLYILLFSGSLAKPCYFCCQISQQNPSGVLLTRIFIGYCRRK